MLGSYLSLTTSYVIAGATLCICSNYRGDYHADHVMESTSTSAARPCCLQHVCLQHICKTSISQPGRHVSAALPSIERLGDTAGTRGSPAWQCHCLHLVSSDAALGPVHEGLRRPSVLSGPSPWRPTWYSMPSACTTHRSEAGEALDNLFTHP